MTLWLSLAGLLASYALVFLSGRLWERYPPEPRGRAPRRGGSPERPASVSASRTTDATPEPAATSTGCSTDGPQRAAPAAQATTHAPSRTTAHGGSGNGTGGDHGQPPAPAGSLEWRTSPCSLDEWRAAVAFDPWSRRVPPPKDAA